MDDGLFEILELIIGMNGRIEQLADFGPSPEVRPISVYQAFD